MEHSKPVALIAPTVVERVLDPARAPVGQVVRIGDKRFTVVGILAGKSRDFLSSIGSSGGQNANDRVVIPYPVLQAMNGSKDINNLQLEVERFDEAALVATRVKKRLLQRQKAE